ncbi:hypothetical protein NKT34_06215 [Paenibacillus polysaccharolyticus]|uniref:hypothetical protein n=1 Tax=Paenibacillus polysaccharolyticus TaxID=582692 RepID=UPI00209EC42E|nr:hypothetical protein [Paenibacillus polysaccharolyticus]MCP1132875.1 hypothetical protein [Paenibacillus polysaccharolyticus]MDP9699598.1 archaellum biogenesis ATPase FlaH [Paenibacillus intestini]
MLRKNYIRILFALLIVILVVTNISQYKTKELYKSTLTNQLNTDITELRSALSSNDLAYEEILQSQTMSKDQSNYLMGNNDEIRKIVDSFSTMAVQLDKESEKSQYTETQQNALKLTEYFKDLQSDNKEQILDSNTKIVLEKAQQLNKKWSTTMTRTQITSIANDSWIELLMNLEKDTRTFLTENKIKSIEEFWLERREIQ